MKELLSDPKRWTKKAPARLDNSDFTYATNPDAVCWCLGGSLQKVALDHNFDSSQSGVLHTLSNIIPQEYLLLISRFNDNMFTTHEDIMKILDKAITLYS